MPTNHAAIFSQFARLDTNRATMRQCAMNERHNIDLMAVVITVARTASRSADRAIEEIADMALSARRSLGQRARRAEERANFRAFGKRRPDKGVNDGR